FNLPLRNVDLKEVLDAVVRVADHPIQYSVEDYGVVISAGKKAEAPQSDVNSFSATSETLNRLEAMRIEQGATLLRDEMTLKRLHNLQSKGIDVLAQTITTVIPDSLLDSLLEQQAAAEQK